MKKILTILLLLSPLFLISCGSSSTPSNSDTFSGFADDRLTLSEQELSDLKSVQLGSEPQFDSQPDLLK
jgi:hypothetical protein